MVSWIFVKSPVYLALMLGLLSCKSVPTSVLLHVEPASGLPPPDELLLTVFTPTGVAVADRRLPATGQPTLPEDVVLYPAETSGTLRLLVRALVSSASVGEGATQVELRAKEQVSATILVTPGLLPDADGDKVPDTIDNCPDFPNPEQGPCTGPDGHVDGPIDAGPPDTGEDAVLDTLNDSYLDIPLDAPAPDTFVCTCPLGCRLDSGVCRELVVSNGYITTSYHKLPAVTGTVTLDTNTCGLTVGSTTALGIIQTPSGGTQACVIGLESLVVAANGTLAVQGAVPLVLLVSQSVTINGLLDLGGKGSTPGPGGANGGSAPSGGPGASGGGTGGGTVCYCTAGALDDCGGGGGGYGSSGAVGGDEENGCATKSTGGASHGNPTLVPLTAGSGGASAGQTTAGMPTTEGGAGGGALQISCQSTITVKGAITAGGGGGRGGYLSGGASGGGGAGSGGGILLEAAIISGTGLVAANGGAGGASSITACTKGGDGEDGGPSLQAAIGGQSGTTACAAGGDGGWGTTLPTPGGGTVNGGGGGGGAVGRIRLNWLNHGATAPVIVSGKISLGEVTAQ